MGSTNHVITPQGEIYYMVGFLIPQLSPRDQPRNSDRQDDNNNVKP